jgi:hexosaminidase
MIAALLGIVTLTNPAPKIELDYRSARGLFATVDGVPLLQGSFFQYYEGNWAKGLYSSNWNQQTVRQEGSDVVVDFGSTEQPASGQIRYRVNGDTIQAEYRFDWKGSQTVNLENTIATIWAVPFEEGHVRVDGNEGRSPKVRIPAGDDPEPRVFRGRGKGFELTGTFADLRVEAGLGAARVFDARSYEQDWARGRELFWLGHERLAIKPGESLRYSATIKVSRKGTGAGQPVTTTLASMAGPTVQPEAPATLVPQPKKMTRLREPAVPLPARSASGQSEFDALLRLRWTPEALATRASNATIRTSVSNLGLPAEGFKIRVYGGEIEVIGQDADGLRHGVRTVAELAEARGGRLWVPAVEIEDYPSISWRGVHLFVGPRARAFQGRMMDRVLAPLRFNHVVLQCERTDWNTTPGIRTPGTMSRKDLADLFSDYRKRNIDPVPLIQSHGHMQWLFANNQNLDLAFNRSVPFAIDPRKPAAREKVKALWDEAIGLLKPKQIHFGMDEINLRGGPADPAVVTEVWKESMKYLPGVAAKHKVDFMIWGDKMLAPGEAPDAALGHNKKESAARRAVVPKGTFIADWHYLNNPDPKVYTSLELFKSQGMRPIASAWNRPGNIAGFAQAAALSGSGYLQTVWAGFESDETAMLREFDQFSAFVLAADYAWSGRKDLPKNVGYDWDREFYRRFYAAPSVATPVNGTFFGGTSPTSTTIGAWAFRPMQPLALASKVKLPDGAPRITLNIDGQGLRTIALALSSAVKVATGEVVARVRVFDAEREILTRDIQYGYDVRAKSDVEATYRTARDSEGRSAITLDLGSRPRNVRRIEIEAVDTSAGLVVLGVSGR